MIDRRKLLEKFNYKLATNAIAKMDDKIHMGCLNGSILKEIVIYKTKSMPMRTSKRRTICKEIKEEIEPDHEENKQQHEKVNDLIPL